MRYQAPVEDLLAAMRMADGFGAGLEEADARAVLEQAAAFAEERLLPLDAIGDRAGVRLEAGIVTTAPGWRDAYAAWRNGGWAGLSAPADGGGSGLPASLNAAVNEIWSAANASFALGPVLTAGAVEALARHGTAEQRALYLPKLVSGEWTGTMNLTEAQAGSDLGALRSRAEPHGDGRYRVSGAKIYITYGEHDCTDNIVHLVLARLPDAPAGSRGISLFLVPKWLPGPDGRPGERNDLVCTGLERKLGMHASPTCSMSFGDKGGATGWLVGEPHRGLHCMFTMMNNARLAVGVQGVAAAERATQGALAYARSRVQGRSAASPGGPGAIVHHPDVARMLMTMQALTGAARALCHLTAAAIDRGEADRAAQLTPVAKAFGTDCGIEVASLGIQVHGGMGYIEDSGAAQVWRDARIAAIYEGTNGIQAIDFVTRKLPLVDAVAGEVAAIHAAARDARGHAGLGVVADRLEEAALALEGVIATLGSFSDSARLAVATPALRLFALARGGAALAAMATVAPADARRAALARFFAESCLPETVALARVVASGATPLDGAEAALLAPQ